MFSDQVDPRTGGRAIPESWTRLHRV